MIMMGIGLTGQVRLGLAVCCVLFATCSQLQTH
jgi:hypothetical protein